MDSLSLQRLVRLNGIRILVYPTVYRSFVNGVIPGLLIFEECNILAGIAAPLITYFGFVKIKLVGVCFRSIRYRYYIFRVVDR